ncbi:hypothetical protein TMatcc_002252 [Talaromyces marneffei ATCC 18224]|uniref:Uncharacterized protein n=2 Tax=Talaromyces marneffei TaxID=37727 RepID=B6QJ51_TALMQ|nr:hypothetical protein PMAA_099790 [Talaromyces marneffei ATCC 18224]
METTSSLTPAGATATVTVTATATATPYFPPQAPSRNGPAVSYGFIALIILLGLLLLLSLGCLGHSFLVRRQARRRGEDPGPVFGSWWWQRNPPMDQTQEDGHQPQAVSGARVQGDGRGREFYNVAGEPAVGAADVRTEQDLKGGGEVGMARYA